MGLHTVSFKGREFRIQEGVTHPAYSIECFTADECGFRDRFWNIQSGEVVVDVGASYGAYSLTAAVMGAQVFALEPEPMVFAGLHQNVLLNPGLNVTAWCQGAWDSVAQIDMMSYAPHWPAGTLTGDFNVAPLDASAFARLDWLKVDVEGCEDRVLRGAQETIARCRPTVIVECHTFLDSTLVEKCKALLPNYHFELVPRDPCWMLIARPT